MSSPDPENDSAATAPVAPSHRSAQPGSPARRLARPCRPRVDQPRTVPPAATTVSGSRAHPARGRVGSCTGILHGAVARVEHDHLAGLREDDPGRSSRIDRGSSAGLRPSGLVDPHGTRAPDRKGRRRCARGGSTGAPSSGTSARSTARTRCVQPTEPAELGADGDVTRPDAAGEARGVGVAGQQRLVRGRGCQVHRHPLDLGGRHPAGGRRRRRGRRRAGGRCGPARRGRRHLPRTAPAPTSTGGAPRGARPGGSQAWGARSRSGTSSLASSSRSRRSVVIARPRSRGRPVAGRRAAGPVPRRLPPHRADAAPEDLGGVALAALLEPAQHDDGPLPRGEVRPAPAAPRATLDLLVVPRPRAPPSPVRFPPARGDGCATTRRRRGRGGGGRRGRAAPRAPGPTARASCTSAARRSSSAVRRSPQTR